MTPKAQAIWSALEFPKPMLLRNVEPLSEAQLRWQPARERPPVAWQVWHIAEVEDNWIRELVLGEPLSFPFGVAVRKATDDQFPNKAQLLNYLHQTRAITSVRLEPASAENFDRLVKDVDFGLIKVCNVWGGVVTSFA